MMQNPGQFLFFGRFVDLLGSATAKRFPAASCLGVGSRFPHPSPEGMAQVVVSSWVQTPIENGRFVQFAGAFIDIVRRTISPPARRFPDRWRTGR